MQAENLFSLAGLAVLPGWLLLIAAPRWRYSASLISGALIPALLCVVYAALIVPYLLGGGEGGFGSLADVRLAFQDDFVLLAGWIHYLAFDLFIGSWELRDARRQGIGHLWLVPCLLLTFLLGPVGLLLYLTLRAVLRRRLMLVNAH